MCVTGWQPPKQNGSNISEKKTKKTTDRSESVTRLHLDLSLFTRGSRVIKEKTGRHRFTMRLLPFYDNFVVNSQRS